MFALVDCNNFYASCERAFNPSLEKKPIVVLSNNDGCVISRSNEAKQLGIPMGAPFYQWKNFCHRHHVFVFSSNYELYGDMSQRVMYLLKEFHEQTEIYSIDEAFLHMELPLSLSNLYLLRQRVKQSTGIPISIGMGSTKTLAKAANQLAKNAKDSVFYFENQHHQDACLSHFPIEKIWGVGRNLSAKLKQLNILTAKDLRDSDPKFLRLHFSVSLEKTIQELNGISCLGLEELKGRKQIISSRSFGKKVTSLIDLEEAVSYYVQIAANKLRKQKSVASAVYVFLRTNYFSESKPQYHNSYTVSLVKPSADTRELTQAAKKGLRQIYKKGYEYNKAGVILLDISQQHIRQYDMLTEVIDNKSEKVMQVMDNINQIMGKNSVFLAAEGIEKSWLIKCDRRSPRYTTRWPELPLVQ